MKHLNALDAMFLYAETAQTPMHLSSVHRLEMKPGYRGDFVAEVRAHVRRRLHLAPILRRKLRHMAWGLLTPVWIEDDDIDLEHHVRHLALPAPGSMKQMSALVGEVQSIPLDRTRPLWELLLVSGFKGRGWVAILKVHHAGIDGQSGQVLIEALFDASARPRKVTAPPAARRRGRAPHELRGSGMLARGLGHTAAQTARLARRLPQLLRAAAGLGRVMSALPAPRTPFNASVTRERVWAGCSIPLTRVRRIARACGVTVNDVVLAICGGALRAYLLPGGQLPDRSLIALMPVSTRQPGDLEMSNRVLIAPVRLHTDRKDPLRQLQDIRIDTARIKQELSGSRGGVPLDPPIIGLPWLTSGVVGIMGRFNKALPLAGNLVITNVMTSPTALYLCGARLATYLPALVLMHGQALGIAIHTYAGSIEVGIIACPRSAPDVDRIATLIVEASVRLARAAGNIPPASKGRPIVPATGYRSRPR